MTILAIGRVLTLTRTKYRPRAYVHCYCGHRWDTCGSTVADVKPHTLPGSEVYNVDLADFTNLLEDYHHLTDKQVMNFYG